MYCWRGSYMTEYNEQDVSTSGVCTGWPIEDAALPKSRMVLFIAITYRDKGRKIPLFQFIS